MWQAAFVLNTSPCLKQLTIDYLLITTVSIKKGVLLHWLFYNLWFKIPTFKADSIFQRVEMFVEICSMQRTTLCA